MMPPEQVTPGTNIAANNAAADAVQRNVKPDSDAPNAGKPQREAAGSAAAPEPPRDASKPTAKDQRRGAGDDSDRAVLAQTRSNRFAAPPKGETRDRAAAPGAQLPEKKALESRQRAAPQGVEEASEREQDLKRKAKLAAASSAARPNAAVSNPPASPSARAELHPFPATPAPAETQASNAPPRVAATGPTPAPAGAPAPAPAVAARKLAAQSSAAGSLSANNAGSSAGNAELAPAEDASALEKKAAGMADKVTAERRKDTVALAPDEWIKRIRRLIAEGKNDDAAKELVAFRREYKERAETLLPADLRAFRP
jgi:hypothetical protein